MRYKQYKNLHQLTFLPHIFPVNIYIYEEEKFLTVADIGLNKFVKEIQKFSLKVNKPVKYLVLTHAHLDHVGGLDLFKTQFPDCQIIISKRDAKLLTQ